MATLDIALYPDPVLRQQALPITQFDSSVLQLLEQMTDTLYGTTGIGLSAPQISRSLQIMVMDLSDSHTEAEVLINPEIVSKSGLAVVEESCLSLPGVAAKVMRSGQIQVRAQTPDGTVFETEYEGMKAVCVQHEIDHLQGKLFIDRLSRLRRYRFRHALRALEASAAEVTTTSATA